MKKIAATILICATIALCSAALAEPSPSPSSGTSSGSLIAFDSKGETVVRIQLRLRELGYFNYKPTGNFQNMTVEATKSFQQKQSDDNGLAIIADGTIGEQSLGIIFRHDAVRTDINAEIPFGSALSGTPSVTGELVDWNEVKTLLIAGRTYVVHDYNTGSTWRMTFTGGENHAEVECTAAVDTYSFQKAFGDEFNYSKRSVVIEIEGRLVAASLQGYPHGDEQVSNNDMTGHACMFFNGSLSHVGNFPDVEHQALIYKAAGRS